MSKQVQGYSCNICGKYSGDLTKAKAHMEAKHFPSSTGYTCHCCDRWFKTKNALSIHMSREHRDSRMWNSFNEAQTWTDNWTLLNEPSPAGKLNSPEDLLNFCEKENGEMSRWTCSLCYQFAHRSRQNVRNHVESRHYPNAFQYSCPSCDKVCYTMRAMEVHKSNVHRSSVWIQRMGKYHGCDNKMTRSELNSLLSGRPLGIKSSEDLVQYVRRGESLAKSFLTQSYICNDFPTLSSWQPLCRDPCRKQRLLFSFLYYMHPYQGWEYRVTIISWCNYRSNFKISLKYCYRQNFVYITRYLIMKYWRVLAFHGEFFIFSIFIEAIFRWKWYRKIFPT